MTTIATLFSGGECVGVGARQAGLTHLWGIEYDDDIANVARKNGFEVITADVMSIDPHTLPVPDVLHASPVCKRASGANQSAELNEDGTKEAPEDIAMGEKVAEFIDVMQPRIFTLENVYAYRNFKAFKTICAALNRGGYMWDFDNLNAADYGVPQTRRRLILRAKRGALLPNLPQPVRWLGWYEAIEDLIPGLPMAHHGNTKQRCEWDSVGRPCRKTGGLCRGHFAQWQELRLPEEIKQALLVDSAGYPDENGARVAVTRQAIEPTNTIVANYGRRPMRAFIVGTNANDSSGARIYQEANEPVQTIRTPGGGRELRAWLMPDLAANPNIAERIPVLCRSDEPSPPLPAGMGTRRIVRAYLIESKNIQQWSDGLRADFEPAVTVTSDHKESHRPKALLISSIDCTTRSDTEPANTIVSVGDGHSVSPRAWLSQGCIVTMTVEALARFQSIPKWYKLSGNKELDCTVIGNGVPCKLYQAIIEGLTQSHKGTM